MLPRSPRYPESTSQSPQILRVSLLRKLMGRTGIADPLTLASEACASSLLLPCYQCFPGKFAPAGKHGTQEADHLQLGRALDSPVSDLTILKEEGSGPTIPTGSLPTLPFMWFVPCSLPQTRLFSHAQGYVQDQKTQSWAEYHLSPLILHYFILEFITFFVCV